MCGIIGHCNFRGERLSRSLFLEALELMNHRGPDGEGLLEKDGQLIGHVRLSIIDLDGGAQPIERDNHIITFNGEIYNYRELRIRLEKLGVKFTTHSDTEVILAGYLHFGSKFFQSLVGMYAFAIHHPDGSVLLHRDQTGQKPLYYFKDSNRLIYSSVLGSLIHIVGKQNLNVDAILLYFYLSYIPSPYCIYENINKLAAGELITIDASGCLSSAVISTIGNQQCTIEDIIKHSTVSDTPIGLSLSAGIDSSVILNSVHPRISKAYTVKSRGLNNNNDEWRYALRFAKGLKVDHQLISSNELNLDSINRIQNKMDEPFGDSSILMADLVAKQAKIDGIKVILTGDGADEFFSGYRKHRALYFMSLIYRMPRLVRMIVSLLMPNKKMRKILSLSENLSEAYIMSLNMGIENSYLKDEAIKIISKEWDIFNSSFIDCLRYDRAIVLEGDMMVKSDRIYMQHGIESRPVFALNIMHEYINKFSVGELISHCEMKLPLKKFASDLPKYILNRKKTGFESPLDKISLEEMNKEIRDLIENALTSSKISNHQLLMNCFYMGIASSSAREKYIVYALSIWIKNNLDQIKWS